jgi:pimeloyl-ACP methyl ester carboxylesterase
MAATLRAANIEGPYVLVAASYGGRVARLFTSQHPEDVLGLVLVDAVHKDARSAEDIADQAPQRRVLAVGNWVLSRLGVARLLGSDLVPLIDGPVGETLPAADRELIAIVSTRPKNLEGNARLDDNQQASDAALRASGGLGARPLIVLSSRQEVERSAKWAAAQAKLAGLSSNSRHVVADGPHLIAWAHPDLVTQAVACVRLAAATSLPSEIPVTCV